MNAHVHAMLLKLNTIYVEFNIYTRKTKSHLRLACRMNVKNETARILRAHAERAASANALVKIYFKLYIEYTFKMRGVLNVSGSVFLRHSLFIFT